MLYRIPSPRQVKLLGRFDTKLEAAICYAEWARDEQRAPPETPPLRVDESRPGPLGEDTSEPMDVGAG